MKGSRRESLSDATSISGRIAVGQPPRGSIVLSKPWILIFAAAVGLAVAVVIVRVAKAPSGSDLSGDEVGATSGTKSSEAAVRRASSADANSPAELTEASEVAETGSDTNSPTSATSRRILRLTLLGPADLAEALVDIEVKERASGFGLSNLKLSTMWKRAPLDIDITSVFAVATPDRLELTISAQTTIRRQC